LLINSNINFYLNKLEKELIINIIFNLISYFYFSILNKNQIPLRQMVYLTIKELSSIAEDVIMVTSSLVKDINSTSETIYRANAIRALCKITDVCTSKYIYIYIYCLEE